MRQDALPVQIDDKRVLAADPFPAPRDRAALDLEKPSDASPLQIGIWNIADLLPGQDLEIKARACRRGQNGAAGFGWRFAQQGSDNRSPPGAIFNDRKVDIRYQTLDDRSDGHDRDHRDENDRRELPTHRLRQETADQAPHASSTVAVKM
nr:MULTISPECIES: hypothetical protein [unclassified Mesorhizobium]